MVFNVDTLINEIQTEYRSLKEKSYPDYLSFISLKNNSKAAELRKQGDDKYGQGEYEKALEFYTRSIALSEEDSEELALAYVNRSAVLFCLGQYKQCMSDADRALITAKRSEVWYKKLLDRKKKCLRKIESESANGGDDETYQGENDCVELSNPLLPNTSHKIKVSYNELWGRHIMATDNIEPGEILSRQKLFAAALIPGRRCTNCSYCFTRCDALISCPSCSQMMYCSNECRDLAFGAYHRTECKMLPFYAAEKHYIGFNIFLALRILYVGTENGARLDHLVESVDIRRDIFAEKYTDFLNKPFNLDYMSMMRLRLTFEKPSGVAVVMAVKTVIFLQHVGGFFSNDAMPDEMSQAELFVALAILNHTSSIICNQYGVTEMTYTGECEIACGVEPINNLFNHSCDPNIFNVTSRCRECIIFAVRPIRRGQQIFASYYLPFWNSDLDARQQYLSSTFKFTCQCVACRDDWPELKTLASLQKMELLHISNPQLFTEIKEMTPWVTGIKLKTTAEVETLSKLVKYRKMIDSKVRLPSSSVVLAEIHIASCMIWRYGMAYRTHKENAGMQEDDDPIQQAMHDFTRSLWRLFFVD